MFSGHPKMVTLGPLKIDFVTKETEENEAYFISTFTSLFIDSPMGLLIVSRFIASYPKTRCNCKYV